MSAERSPKKSETLEIRIPYPTKTALMEKARAEGRAASEIVREQIDAYLAAPPPPATLRDRALALVRRNARGAALLLAGAGSAMAIGLAASPATARPEVEPAFATLDAEGDGVVSLAESDGKTRAVLRYRLDTGTPIGVVPLTIAIDLPDTGVTGAELAQLVGTTFDRLDGSGS